MRDVNRRLFFNEHYLKIIFIINLPTSRVKHSSPDLLTTACDPSNYGNVWRGHQSKSPSVIWVSMQIMTWKAGIVTWTNCTLQSLASIPAATNFLSVKGTSSRCRGVWFLSKASYTVSDNDSMRIRSSFSTSILAVAVGRPAVSEAGPVTQNICQWYVEVCSFWHQTSM